MSLRTVAVLGVALVAAVVLVVWLDAPRAPGGARPGDGGGLLPAGIAEIRAVEIEQGGETIRLQHSARRGWQVVLPTEAPADPERVSTFLDAVARCGVDSVVERKAATLQTLEPFGLVEPQATLRVFGSESEPARVLRVGNRSPVGGERYVSTDDGAVLLVDGTISEILAADARQFVDRRFVPVPPWRIASLSLERGGRSLGLRRVETGWRLTEPLSELADARAAESVAEAAAALVVERIVDRADIDPQGHGLPEALVVEITVTGDDEPIELEIGGRASRTRLYACRAGDRGMCGTVDAARVLELMKDPDELRARSPAPPGEPPDEGDRR